MSLRSSRRLSTISTDSSRLAAAIYEFRQRFQPDGLRRCSQLDASRIMREEWWLAAFLSCYDCDVDVVLAVAAECIRWRNAFRVEQIGMLSVKPLLDRRLMFIHGYDVEQSSILWIRMAAHLNGERDSERLFVFWLERHFNESRGAPLSVVVDMTHATLKNMDYNLFKFILHALKFYYPNCAQDLLVYETSSMLGACWKVIRSWLDVGHPQLQLVTRESIKQFIPSVFLPIAMGGEDPFEFTMDELAHCMPARNGDGTPVEADENARPDLDNFPSIKRSVKFEEEDEAAHRRSPLVIGNGGGGGGGAAVATNGNGNVSASATVVLGQPPTVRRSSKGPSGRRSALPASLRPLAERRVHAPQADWASPAPFMAVTPIDELCLARLEDEADLVDVVAVRNESTTTPLLFKIKTTSPEKFRVRPSSGIVMPSVTETVRVYLQAEYRMTAGKEKFLLMALLTSATCNVDDFAEHWRTAEPSQRAEHKLRCRVMDDTTTDGISNGILSNSRRGSVLAGAATQQQQIEPLRDEIAELGAQQRLLGLFVVFLVVLQFVCMLNERSNSASLRLAIEALTAERNSPNMATGSLSSEL